MTEEINSRPLTRLDHRVMNVVLARIAWLFFKIYGRLKVVGVENVPASGPVILAANHASYLDPPLGWAALYSHRRPWGIAKSELWSSKVLAYLLDCVGVYPVKRNSADRAMFRIAVDLLNRGEVVGLFPEGTRTSDGRLQPGRAGIALLVQKSRAPVIPVALLGTFEMLPRHRNRLRRSRLTVAFGAPIRFSPEATRDEIVETIMVGIADTMTRNGCPAVPASSAENASVKLETTAQ